MKLQTWVQSILVSIFRLGLLRLSAVTYEATFSTAANVVSHLERFWHTSFQFGENQKTFLLSLRGKIIANILQFLGRRESKLARKNSKKLPKLFHLGFAEKNFKQKRPECPFNNFTLTSVLPFCQYCDRRRVVNGLTSSGPNSAESENISPNPQK